MGNCVYEFCKTIIKAANNTGGYSKWRSGVVIDRDTYRNRNLPLSQLLALSLKK